MPNYYIRNRFTGESSTREFVERFVTNWASPDECERSYYDSIYGITHGGMQDTYLSKSNTVRQKAMYYEHPPATIGRASRLSSGKNSSEILWCIKIDISKAAKRLSKRQREVLMYRYVYDIADDKIAEHFGVVRQHVSRMASQAFDALAKYLDYGNL